MFDPKDRNKDRGSRRERRSGCRLEKTIRDARRSKDESRDRHDRSRSRGGYTKEDNWTGR